ncbi:HEAT repeat domain-containing protein [Amycolatopsis sp. cg9]|uniref:HEAT repeat domain-containing protein n=1 Tax=Amycolatopsis sp. cg9 TaxID=3238801 RepID=UPI0035246A5D
MGDATDHTVWSQLRHNYGDASDLPDLLRACASTNAAQAAEALDEVDIKVFHQGGWVCSAAPAALPWLADLATDPAVHHRHEVVELIGRLAREAVSVAAKFVDPGWQPALDLTRPRLLTLLADPDPRVRRAATLMVAGGIRHPEAVAALRHRWVVETDRTTRADLVLAFGVVSAWAPEEALRNELLPLLTEEDLQLRLAAVRALAKSEPALAAGQVDTLARAVLEEDAALWRDSAWIGGTPATLVRSTGDLLLDDRGAATAFAFLLARARDGEYRVAALDHTQQVLSRWRTGTAEILPLLAERLDDELPEARYRAAALMACLGSQAATYADQLAARSTDAALRDAPTPATVGDAAVWALARQDHPGCLPGLVKQLSGTLHGFQRGRSYFRPGVTGLFDPGIGEVLIPLHRHADALLGPLTARLAAAGSDHVLASQLCEVVAAWGPAAAAALPAVVKSTAHEMVRPAAAKAIGAIGPAAVDAARRLREHVAEPTVAWALWRTGADPDLGITALTQHITQPELRPKTIALLADLESHAASCTDVLRTLTGSTDDWTRAEAAYALWRVTGDPTEPMAVLTELAEPLAQGRCLPVRIAALRHLADMAIVNDHVTAVARAITVNPHRIAYFGGWRVFTEDEEIRTAASALLG